MISTIVGVMSVEKTDILIISQQSLIRSTHVISREFYCIFEEEKNDFLFLLLT